MYENKITADNFLDTLLYNGFLSTDLAKINNEELIQHVNCVRSMPKSDIMTVVELKTFGEQIKYSLIQFNKITNEYLHSMSVVVFDCFLYILQDALKRASQPILISLDEQKVITQTKIISRDLSHYYWYNR